MGDDQVVARELEQAEARENVEWRFEAIYAEGGRQALDTYARAIRASERAKYAALEREVRNVLRHLYAENTASSSRTFPALDRALAALQSKEGTNE